jgi:RNA polymerase sigma factor (sigma-70 family)
MFQEHSDQRLYQHDVLSREQTDELLARYRRLADRYGAESKRAIAVRNKLVTANLKLVAFVAKRFQTPRGWSPEDVRACGVSGLIKAIETFDASHGTALGTHAVWQIRHSIGRAVADLGLTVRVPVHVQESARKGLDSAPIRAAAAARRMFSTDVRVDGPDGDGNTTFGDFLLDTDAAPATDTLIHGETTARMQTAIAALPEQLRLVIELRMRGLTWHEVATQLGLGRRERVQALEDQAHALLRRALGAGERAA